MKTSAIAISLLALSASACAAPVRCPVSLSDAGARAAATLVDVWVLSYPASEKRPPVGEAQPISAPDEERPTSRGIELVWHLDDAPGYLNQVECHYKGRAEPLGFNLVAARKCIGQVSKKGVWLSFACE